MTEDQWDRMMQCNLKSAFYCIKMVLPHMVKEGRGKIINIVSTSAKTGGKVPPGKTGGLAHYAASKAALNCLTKSLATELASKGITVNAIAPGVIVTRMTKDIVKYFEKVIPVGRIGHPEEVANVALFLASDMASYLTGEIIDVNGGLYMD
jgi:3-oxoacyl-[acyl-carrier protein] reductase